MRRRRVQMGEAMPRPVPSERGVEWGGGGQAGLQSGTEGESGPEGFVAGSGGRFRGADFGGVNGGNATFLPLKVRCKSKNKKATDHVCDPVLIVDINLLTAFSCLLKVKTHGRV